MAKKRKASHSSKLWDAIKVEYELGVYSIRSIAEKHGISEGAIRLRAKNEGWQQQFAMHVEARRRALLLPVPIRAQTTQPPPDPTPEQEAAIDDAARAQVDVILGHRKRVRETTAIVDAMLGELRGHTLHLGTIEEMIELHYAGGGINGAMIRQGLHQSLKLAGRAGTVVKLVDAMGRLTALERQAFGLGAIDSDVAIDPIKREREAKAAGQVDGRSDLELASLVLSFIERASRQRQAAPNQGTQPPGTSTRQ